MASKRIVIAGASSLLGTELKSLLEESRFAGADFSLVDEDLAAGTLTEAAGEPAVIRPVEEDSFDRANIIFFSGSAAFTTTNLALAQRSGAIIVDLSGALVADRGATIFFPGVELLATDALLSGKKLCAVPSAAAMAAAALSLALSKFAPEHLSFLAFQPVSEAGKKGIEELEQQTGQLLSFQSVGSPVFDTQVGFNLLDRFGPSSKVDLAAARERLRAEIAAILAPGARIPAVQLIHAPVFYGAAFSMSAKFDRPAEAAQLVAALKSAGFHLAPDSGSSNLSAAGQSFIELAAPEKDPSAQDLWWFWGAGDNIRLPAFNAVKVAEKLLP